MEKSIIGYEGLYTVSDTGVVKSTPRKGTKGGEIKVIKDEYYEVVLCKDMKMKRFNLHRLIATAFIPNPENKPQVNHINGDKYDNRIENLEWCNNSENQLHSYRIGLRKSVRGEKNGNAKLTDKQVVEIYSIIKSRGKNYGRKELALKYSVSECTIKEIATNRRYTSHV